MVPAQPVDTLFPYTTLFRSMDRKPIDNEDLVRATLEFFAARTEAALHRRRLQRLPVERGLQRSEEHTSELQSRRDLVCRRPLDKKNETHPFLQAIVGLRAYA